MMIKRGLGNLVIIAIVGIIVVVVVALVFGFGIGGTTGKATLEKETEGAFYGGLGPSGYTRNCRYIVEDDGWSVTQRQEIIYTLYTEENEKRKTDSCISTDSVKEYHCESGRMRVRNVRCPVGTFCRDGICKN